MCVVVLWLWRYPGMDDQTVFWKTIRNRNPATVLSFPSCSSPSVTDYQLPSSPSPSSTSSSPLSLHTSLNSLLSSSTRSDIRTRYIDRVVMVAVRWCLCVAWTSVSSPAAWSPNPRKPICTINWESIWLRETDWQWLFMLTSWLVRHTIHRHTLTYINNHCHLYCAGEECMLILLRYHVGMKWQFWIIYCVVCCVLFVMSGSDNKREALRKHGYWISHLTATASTCDEYYPIK